MVRGHEHTVVFVSRSLCVDERFLRIREGWPCISTNESLPPHSICRLWNKDTGVSKLEVWPLITLTKWQIFSDITSWLYLSLFLPRSSFTFDLLEFKQQAISKKLECNTFITSPFDPQFIHGDFLINVIIEHVILLVVCVFKFIFSHILQKNEKNFKLWKPLLYTVEGVHLILGGCGG